MVTTANHTASPALSAARCCVRVPFRNIPCRISRHRGVRRFTAVTVNAAEDESQRVDSVVEDLNASGNIMAANPAFAAAFQGALTRQGVDALKRNTRPVDDKKPSPAEEVLHQGLRQARRNILQLEYLKKQVEHSIVEETRQFERIQFALKRATSDTAYIRTLQKMREDDKNRIEALMQDYE